MKRCMDATYEAVLHQKAAAMFKIIVQVPQNHSGENTQQKHD